MISLSPITSKVVTVLLLAAPFSGLAQSTPNDQVSADFLRNMHMKPMHKAPGISDADGGGSSGSSGKLGNRSNGNVLGIDTLPNWSSSYYEPGTDQGGSWQFTWQYTMIGNSPFARNDNGDDDDFRGATTTIGAPVIPVSLDLRNADGSVRYVNGHRLYSDATKYVAVTLNSPVFSKTAFDSSEVPTQFADAVQRAEFFHKSSDDWHTLLRPRVGTPRTLVLKAGTYTFALNDDGTCCAFVLIDSDTFINGFYPSEPTDTSTPLGAAENAGDARTTDLSTFLYPNAFLYFNGDPNLCCGLGFHNYDVEPGTQANGWREKRYVIDYASWITPGILGGAPIADVAALSHEVVEAFNDPFTNNISPWWLAPNGVCMDGIELADVIEGSPTQDYPIQLNGMVYHVQNVAMLQWIAGVTPSTAIHKAYSYPDTTLLTSASVSMNLGCTGPFVQ